MKKLSSFLALIVLFGVVFSTSPIQRTYASAGAVSPALSSTTDVNEMTPFWETTTMYHEAVMMISDKGGLAEAPLLFTPIKILSVQNSALTITYKEGVDWVLENGKLKLPKGSSIPYMTTAEIYPTKPGDTTDKVGGGYVFCQESTYLLKKQISVTYTHAANVWSGPVPDTTHAALPRTQSKLKNGEPLTMLLYGDSITVGASSSGFWGIAPNLPGWGELLASRLSSYYGTQINVVNRSVGGRTSQEAADFAQYFVPSAKADLVVIAYGMNDSCSVEQFGKNIQTIMNAARTAKPNCEFLLVSPMLANPETTSYRGQDQYLKALQSLESDSAVVVNITDVHRTLLQKKRFIDMTGNNVNHPNDFLMRWYAQMAAAPLLRTNSTLCNLSGISELPTAVISGKTVTAKVSTAKTSLTLTATVSEGASVQGYSDSACTQTLTQPIKLAYGANTAYLKVIARDGKTSKVYTVTVTRPVPSPGITAAASAKFIANGKNKLAVRGTLKLTSGFKATVSLIVKNASGKIVAVQTIAHQTAGTKTLSWDGRATKGNTAGLKAGALVPAAKKGTTYYVWLKATVEGYSTSAVSGGVRVSVYGK